MLDTLDIIILILKLFALYLFTSHFLCFYGYVWCKRNRKPKKDFECRIMTCRKSSTCPYNTCWNKND